MIYRPNLLAFADTFIVFLNALTYYFVYRMEQLDCVNVEKSWRHQYLKLYTAVNILVTVLTMTVPATKGSIMFYYNVRPALHLFLVYVFYTYTYELKCTVQGNDIFVMEFLKLYALIRIFIVILGLVAVVSLLFSFMPRYQSMMNIFLGSFSKQCCSRPKHVKRKKMRSSRK